VSEPAQGTKTPGARRATRGWLRKLGAAGFLFFLIKGLLWLVVPAALVAWQALSR
jgi:hypothetical protein